MQKARAGAVDGVMASVRLLHREGLDAVALGRPGGDRRQRHAIPGAVRGALPAVGPVASEGAR